MLIFVCRNYLENKYTNRYILAMGKAERTKQFIIEQVAPVFNKKGYAATSLQELTETTGLSKGAIYGNFKNKDEVAVFAFEYNLTFIKERLRANMQSAHTSLDRLLAYPKTFREIFRQVLQAGGCPIVNTAVDSGNVNEPLQEAVRAAIGEWKESIVSLVDSGIDCGEFAKDSDSEKTAQVLICLVEGGYAMTKATGEEGYIQNALSLVESIILALKQSRVVTGADVQQN
jgi:TetR/AcrR family transcriptional regulator, transcriptional repressor for nem operon